MRPATLRKRDGGGKWRVAERAGSGGFAEGERGMAGERRCSLKAGGRMVPADIVHGVMVRAVDDPNMMAGHAVADDIVADGVVAVAADVAEAAAEDVAVRLPSAASHS